MRACFALSKLLTSGYKTGGPDLEGLSSILSAEVYQLHLDQRPEMLFNEVCCSPSHFGVGYEKMWKIKGQLCAH